ncbi:MAG: hypothetical protein HOP10_04490 [Chitinophagaceae bacterium]|nr:hypothetical protein [Chitinophagaceae bacterium]
MKLFFAIFCCCSYFFSYAQSCSCLDEFYFIKDHIEKNHGGFNKKIGSTNEPAYKRFTDQLEENIKKDKSEKYCIAWLKKYILYLQDHHSNFTPGSGKVIKEDSAAALEAFFKSKEYLSTESINLNNISWIHPWKNREPNGIEGIYHTPDSIYVVAMLKDQTDRRDYVAVILDSKTKLWSQGQVKIELKQVNDSLFDAFIYLRNHSMNYEQIVYKNGRLEFNGWNKLGIPAKNKQAAIDKELIRFTVLDSSTTLLSIRSFSAAIFSKLDSAYKNVFPLIKKYPHLIIDVRNNGGGSDWSYNALMPLIYTDPFDSDVVEYYSTPANIKAYQDYDDQLKKSDPFTKPVFTNAIGAMNKVSPYSFVPTGNGKPRRITYTKNNGFPEKIAVLYNRNCASSCESLLFEVMHSSKSLMVGENSGGYTGYGNVMTITTPCGNQLSWTTTVYRNQWKYEFVGIPPQYKIPDNETDWVEYTRKLLHR